MTQPAYRAGINLELDPTQAALYARIAADPAALAACQAERDVLHAEDERGNIFQRCHVSRVTYQALTTALKQAGIP